MNKSSDPHTRYRPALIPAIFAFPPIVAWATRLLIHWDTTIYHAAVKGLIYASSLAALMVIDYYMTQAKIQDTPRYGIILSALWGPFTAVSWEALGYGWSQLVGTASALLVFGLFHYLSKKGWLLKL